MYMRRAELEEEEEGGMRRRRMRRRKPRRRSRRRRWTLKKRERRASPPAALPIISALRSYSMTAQKYRNSANDANRSRGSRASVRRAFAGSAPSQGLKLDHFSAQRERFV
jgi:hypothetical protein